MELHMLFSSFAFCLQFNIQEVKVRITDDEAQFWQFLRAPAKIGPDTNSHSLLCCLRPDFGRNADWLLEQCHRI